MVGCTRCTDGGLVEIRMRVGESDLTFRRCARCDSQVWETAAGPVALSDVLDLARARH